MLSKTIFLLTCVSRRPQPIDVLRVSRGRVGRCLMQLRAQSVCGGAGGSAMEKLRQFTTFPLEYTYECMDSPLPDSSLCDKWLPELCDRRAETCVRKSNGRCNNVVRVCFMVWSGYATALHSD